MTLKEQEPDLRLGENLFSGAQSHIDCLPCVNAWIGGDCWLPPNGQPLLPQPALKDPLGLFVCNLECAVPVTPPHVQRRALLPLAPERLKELAVAETTVCVLANNHVTDYGPAGVLATLDAVRAANLKSVGAGPDLDAARQPLIVEVGTRRLAMLAYADTRPHVGAVAATPSSPGIAPLDAELVVADLRNCRNSADDLWLIVHWGREHHRYPEPEQRELAKRFAEAGATLIVGIHAHVVQGTELVARTPVYYSLGNFVFPPIPLSDGPLLRWHHENNRGISLQGRLVDDAWLWSHLPHVVSESGCPRFGDPMGDALAERSTLLCDSYHTRYPDIRRREIAAARWRRWQMMTWEERLRLPARLLREALRREARHQSGATAS